MNLPIDEESLKEINEKIQREAKQYLEDRERIKQELKNNPEQARKETAAVLICIFTFIGLIVLLTVFMMTEPILCMSCFGVILAVFSTMAIVQHGLNWNSWFVPLFPVVGAVLTALPIIDVVHRNSTGETIFTKRFIIVIMTVVFTFAGLVMIVVPIIKRHINKKIYTQPISAVCIFIKTKIMRDKDGTKILFAPKWEYSVGGNIYEYQETEYSNIGVPEIGEERQININPDAPDQAYRLNPGSFALLIVGGLMCLAFSCIMVYFEFFAQ